MSSRALLLGFVATGLFVGCGDGAGGGPQGKVEVPDFDVDAAAQRMGSGYARVGELAAMGTVELTPERGFAGYTFRAVRGQRVTITLASPAMDAYLYVYGPEAEGRRGRSIARNDDAQRLDARVQLTAPATGQFLVVATTYRNASTQRAGDRGTLTLAVDDGSRAAPELGSGDHSAQSVTVATVLEGLNRPTGLAFNPANPTQLWVVNQGNDSLVVADLAQSPPMVQRFRDASVHFLIMPTSISFASDQTFGTCQENSNDYRGRMRPNNFMGPVVYTSDVDAFRRRGVAGSHLDMVHHSPFCMGIANTEPREFWVFNGQAGAIDKYQFNEWHELGADDHADGRTWRFADGELARVANVPGHMAWDRATHTLYVADTGHGRIVRIDTSLSTEQARPLNDGIRETPLHVVPDTHVEVVVGEAGQLRQPSGLVLYHGLLFVSDHATGRISAFTTAGERVNWVDTGLGMGALAGIAFGPDGLLYALHNQRNTLLRIEP